MLQKDNHGYREMLLMNVCLESVPKEAFYYECTLHAF